MKKWMSKLALLLACCILLGGCSGKSNVSPEQKRLFTFGAVVATRDGTDFNSVSGVLGIYKAAYKEGLEESWDVVDHDSAIETLEWLKTEGHRLPESDEYYGYDEIFHIASGRQPTSQEELDLLDELMMAYDECVYYLVNDYGYTEAELENITTVAAWDYDRLVTLARWCYGVDYISEDEMWEYINWAAAQGVEDYGSWREYFAGAVIGRSFWAPEYDFMEENKEVCDALLESNDSPYKQSEFRISSI